MGVKRYWAKSDNTITNAYEENLVTRASSSNMGASDILETFSIFAQANSSSAEESRILIKFDITASSNSVKADRTAGTIPVSGNVAFYLRMFNARHSKTVPVDYTLSIRAVAQTWQEGVGLDLENYSDITRGSIGANWMSASNTMPWTGSSYATYDSVGGSYRTGSADPQFKKSFETGLEDLEIDISMQYNTWKVQYRTTGA